MTRILGISGSLRRGSYNSALLRAAQGLMPEGAELVAGSIRGIPLYDGDLEAAEGIPEAVKALKAEVAAAEGLILFTPEYNNGIPGCIRSLPAKMPPVTCMDRRSRSRRRMSSVISRASGAATPSATSAASPRARADSTVSRSSKSTPAWMSSMEWARS
jgi:hypothetical protein